MKVAMLVLSLVIMAAGCKKSFEDEEYGYNDGSKSDSNKDVTSEETTSESNVSTAESNDDYTLDSDVTYIHCNNTSFDIEGNAEAVDVKKSSVKCEIVKGGTFYIDGSLDDGQIQVDAEGATVKIVLNGVALNCSSEAALRVKECEKTIVTIADGTTNTIADGVANEDSAAVYSKRYLSFNAGEKGTGILKVTAQTADGIACTKELVIKNGKFDVAASDDAFRGKQCLVIHDGDFTINAGGDGLKSTSEELGCGYVAIDNGTFGIKAVDEGIQAENNVEIAGGTFGINCTKGKGIAGSAFVHIIDGDFNITSAEADGIHSGAGYVKIEKGTYIIDTPTDGIQAEGSLTIEDGSFGITKADKCISALGNITINGGNFTLTPTVTGGGENGSGHGITVKKNDSGVRTGNVTINGGKINITQCYEGIQGVVINVNDGEIWVNSSDDAFNASDGSNSGFGGFGPRPGQNTTTSSAMALNFNGGFVYVKSTGDGVDSNGELNVTGGVLLVSQYGSMNEPVDAGDGYEPKISGGVVVAVGSQGMASAPNATQTAFFTSTTGSANSVLAVNDSNGKNILAWKVPQSYQVVTVSAPEMGTGTYTMITGATVSGSEYKTNSGFYYPAESATGSNTANINTTNGSCASTGGNGGGVPGGGPRF